MTYRDDVDTLYTRAMILQKELDRANEQLERREEELIALRGRGFGAEDTSPGMRALRTLPDPDDVLARLVDATDARPASAVRWLPGQLLEERVPDPDDGRSTTISGSLPREEPRPTVEPMSRAKVLERVRDRLGALDEESLVMIGTIVEELGDEAPLDRSELLDRLRPIADRITQSFWRRR